MRTGIVLPTTVPGTTGADLAAWAQKAEAAGFDSIAVVDLPGHDAYEPFIALTLAAAVTERVELVANLVVGPLGAADSLAAQADTVDRMSLRRLTLGVRLPEHNGGFDIDRLVRAAAVDDHLRRLGHHRMLLGGDPQQASRRLMTGGEGWMTTVVHAPAVRRRLRGRPRCLGVRRSCRRAPGGHRPPRHRRPGLQRPDHHARPPRGRRRHRRPRLPLHH